MPTRPGKVQCREKEIAGKTKACEDLEKGKVKRGEKRKERRMDSKRYRPNWEELRMVLLSAGGKKYPCAGKTKSKKVVTETRAEPSSKFDVVKVIESDLR